MRDPLDELDDLQQLYQLAPAGLCAVDRDLRFVRANLAYACIVGRTVEEVVGRTMHEVLREPARSPAIEIARRPIETGEPVIDHEIRSVALEDPTRPRIFRVNVHPMHRGGEIVGSMAVMQDITSVRLAEEEALERLRELESIYANAPVALSFVDRDLRYLRVNQQLADLNGASVEAMVGRRYEDFSPETAPFVVPFLKGLMAQEEPIRNLELRSRPPADPANDHLFLFNMDPVRGADGRIVGFVSAVQDITGLRRAEEDAARRLREIETLYASAPVGLCHLDANLHVVHLNALFAQISPLPLEAQVGRRVTEVLPDALARQLVPELAYVVRSGEATGEREVRGTLPGSGGREYTWVCHAHPVQRGAEVTGIVVVLQDVSILVERRRAVERVRDRLDEAQRVSGVGSWDWDLLGDRVWWSREMYEIFGEGPGFQPSFVAFFDHVHPEDQPRVRALIDATLGREEAARASFRIVRADGTEQLVSAAARLERTPEGIAARVVGTCQAVYRTAERASLPTG